MATSFFFYDLETSGINPRDARIMQFAGLRTDMALQPIGDPVNLLIRLAEDVVPEPDAIMITGITPQQTVADGITEAEFLRIFHDEVATDGTIFVGYNTVRFDDEFMRYLHYRNFYDPYEWQYTNQKSRWDMLDLVRMTRALRPEGITWPVDDAGKPTNRLELLTKANNIAHEAAHDALSDVTASIALAQLIQQKQPKLFEYLLSMRDKKRVNELAHQGQPFVYSSGKYPSEFEKTAVVGLLADHPQRQAALVFDLRHNPADFENLSVDELVEAWRYKKDQAGIRLPVKTLQYNRCPAVAPLAVLDATSQERLSISIADSTAHYKSLQTSGLAAKVIQALAVLDAEQESKRKQEVAEIDARLYDGFFAAGDKSAMRAVASADSKSIADVDVSFTDERLRQLLPLYKARNYPKSLSDSDRQAWEEHIATRLMAGDQNSRLGRFFERLSELSKDPEITAEKQYLLEELQLYGQSIMPVQDN